MAGIDAWPAFCRDCLADARIDEPCLVCGSTRILAHPELETLAIAHLDCDAFYAAIEKRDDPSLNDKPLIVGGDVRGVVATCCYIARKSGVHSAMPMFQARKLCPQAVVLPPRISYYAGVSRQIREMMRALTPLVEPLSLDEAYLDLSGTARIHHMSPALTMAKLTTRIEKEIGITVSVGLSGNKFLAKLASDLDKPRGFAVIGQGEAKSFLRDKPVGMIRGAGKAMQARLAREGFTTIGQLQDADPGDLARRLGGTGLWLWHMAQAVDHRPVTPDSAAKVISSETTFARNIAALPDLESALWQQAEHVSARAKAAGLCGHTVVLKLKTADFRLKTRSHTLDAPTQLADRIFRAALAALKREANGTHFRLLGVGLANLAPEHESDPASLIDPGSDRRAAAERAMDRIRAKFGKNAVGTGRGLKGRR
jgi:DNA polymerase-4